MKDSVRKFVAMALWAVTAGGCATLLCAGTAPHDIQELAVSVESGKTALRKGDPCKAETMFARAGDELGIAEALILQKRYDEAGLILERHPTDAKAWLFAALIARGKGDAGGGKALLMEAAEMGSEEARDLLAAEAAG
jgi:hypothetical protein